MKKSSLGIALLGLLCWTSCKKDDNTPSPQSGNHNVLIACEGSFGTGNSSLHSYSITDSTVSEDLFQAANGFPVGDVLQQVLKVGQHYWLLVNNSNVVYIVNTSDFKMVKKLEVNQPKAMFLTTDNRVFIGSYYSKQLLVCDANTQTAIDTLQLPFESPISFVEYQNQVLVGCWDINSQYIYQINNNNSIVDSFQFSNAAVESMGIDKDNHLWVLSGNNFSGVNYKLSRIQLANFQVQNTFELNDNGALKLSLNPAKDEVYFLISNFIPGSLSNGLYKVSIYAQQLPTQAFIPCGNNQNFWSYGIDPKDNHLFIGDPKDYTQRGSVYIFSQAGQALHEFTVGVAPTAFYFL